MKSASIAQLVEQSAVNRSVVGSSPTSSAMWLVGETVNSHAFHACIHGFESRTSHHFGGLAQLGEHLPYKQRVSGSSPLASTI